LPTGVEHIQADLTDPESLEGLPRDVDYVVFCASAGESSDLAYGRVYVEGMKNLIEALDSRPVRRLFFTSSTAVYAQTDGSWVDEDSATEPTRFSGVRTLEAERVAESGPFACSVLRCAGIYGPGRTRLIDAVRAGRIRPTKRLTNRIHRDDVAGALQHLMVNHVEAARLILCDDAPTPQNEVVAHLASRLQVPVPTESSEASFDEQRGGHKKCRNAALRATGYALAYPSYREGYDAMLRS
jgi:nucleoside-diphosphate-sugar epimerase